LLTGTPEDDSLTDSLTDPSQPSAPAGSSPANTAPGTNATPQAQVAPAASGNSWSTGNGPVIVFMVVAIPVLAGFSILAAWGIHRAGGQIWKAAAEAGETAKSYASANTQPARHAHDSAAQNEAEALLTRAASGDGAAVQQVIADSDGWTGRTHRTPRTDQLITASLNSRDMDVRSAAVTAELAFDGVPRSEQGVAMVEGYVGNPNQRAWALWMLGALANRGVDPIHTEKVIESYLSDPDVRTRGTAVDALALVGSNETVPMLLDRFRNDPSPVVQERAACDIAESGMYTHAQRMVAAQTLVGWVDDSLLSAQQRGWALQALADISGKNFGPNSAAWKSWLAQRPQSN
jgi:HEAT repeats